MKRKQAKRERPYSVDRLMRTIASNLARDFRPQLSASSPAVNVVSIFDNGTIEEIRQLGWDVGSSTDAYQFKCRYQMESLFKRYRFEKDLMSAEELEEAAEMQFFDNQLRLADLDLSVLPAYCKHLLFVARGYCHMILGNYDLEEHLALSRFGRKASVGIPMREATEAARYELPITGSVEHIVWFSRVALQEDDCARSYVYSQADGDKPLFRAVDTLALTFVPKTFKSLRSIMPNTTIGTFYSDGLGKVISKRLKAAGYDIATLQERHGELARLASITGKLVTADQSLASDNITLDLVKAVVPDRWFEALNLGRIGKVKLPSGLVVHSKTFCTMGIGFTFPLQTLIFLCLLKAIDHVYTHGRSEMSVYGDDMIYSVDMHPFVLTVFDKLGLKINADKTFAEGCFRESCGSDYYAGADVRPFLPKNERGSLVDRKNYELLLYGYYNGLKRRWHPVECPTTFDYLLAELDQVSRGICRVPWFYPDQSGVKVDSPYDMLGIAYRLAPLKFGKHGQVFFKYLRFIANTKKETRHAPYLWRSLGSRLDSPVLYGSPRDVGKPGPSRVLRSIEGSVGISSSGTPIFQDGCSCGWPRKGRRKPHRCGKQADTFIAEPGGRGRVLRQTGVTVHWTP